MVAPVIELGKCDPLLANNGLTNACLSQVGIISISPTDIKEVRSLSCTDFIYCQTIETTPLVPPGPGVMSDICTVGNCMQINPDVPIKQLISGTMASPWVRLRFPFGLTDGPEYDYTEITTGNISQPGVSPPCRASIKLFQYGWGSVNSGNICKIQIVDEAGSSFSEWVKRIARNPQTATTSSSTPGSVPLSGQGVYRMKVTFGWLISGDCPSQVTGAGCATPTSTGSCCSDIAITTANGDIYSNNPNQLLCSPPLWFLPGNITVTVQNGKFIYEIEGTDSFLRAQESPSQRSYGAEPIAGSTKATRTHFRDAVQRLAAESLPPFLVDFKQLNETTGNVECLQFFVPPNTSIVSHEHLNFDGTVSPQLYPPGTKEDFVYDLSLRGPLDVWQCKGLNPMAAIQQWMTKSGVRAVTTNPVLASMGKGLTVSYDSTFTRYGDGTDCADPVAPFGPTPPPEPPIHGRVIIWADGFPNYSNQKNNFGERTKALYIVNGGKSSPVFGFTPNIKWNWNAAALGGGTTGPGAGTQSSNSKINSPFKVAGVGPRNETVTATGLLNQGLGGRDAVRTQALHKQANTLFNPIEAELRVQGDPSDWLCTPLLGYARTIALVVINPFYIDNPNDADCPVWSTLTRSPCNEILTNPNWMIKGVDHQIKEGSYVTTYKLILLAPGSELPGGTTVDQIPGLAVGSSNGQVMQLGGASFAGTNIPEQKFFCQQNTWACEGFNVIGGDDNIVPGTSTFCEDVCTTDLVVS